MRKREDSNLRYPFGYNSFQNCPFQPLRHASKFLVWGKPTYSTALAPFRFSTGENRPVITVSVSFQSNRLFNGLTLAPYNIPAVFGKAGILSARLFLCGYSRNSGISIQFPSRLQKVFPFPTGQPKYYIFPRVFLLPR